jgi:hypothetical protein
VQEFTIELKKRAIQLGVSLKILEKLMKYLGALHYPVQRQLMLFKPKSVDEASVEVQYFEGDKRK